MTEATLVLKVDSREVSKGKKSLDELNASGAKAEKTTKGLTSATQTMTKAVLAAAAAYASYKLASLIKESTLLAARFETMGIVMNVAGNNAGYAAAEMERYSKELQKSGISMLQSRNTLTQLATAHIDLSKAQDLGRAAQNLAVVANINSSDAMATMIRGIKTGRTMILQTMGLNVNFAASYAALADQIGVNVKELTSEQRVLARTNIVLQEAARFTGIYEKSMETAGKQILSLDRHVENLKIKIGDVFLPALSKGVVEYTDALKDANAAMDKWAADGTLKAWADKVIPALEAVAGLVAIGGLMYTGVIAMPAAWLAMGAMVGNFAMEFESFRGTVAGVVEKVVNAFLWLQKIAAKTMVYVQAVFSGDIVDTKMLNRQLDMIEVLYLRSVLTNKAIAEGTRERIAHTSATDDATRAAQDAADIEELKRLAAVAAERAILLEERATAKLLKKQEELLDTLYPLIKAQKEYDEHISTLNKIYPDTIKGHKDHADAIKRLQIEYIELFPELQRQQDEAERMADAWEEAGYRIDEAFADAWKGAFDSFEDFGDSILDALKTLLAEMAHMLITKKLMINIAGSMGLGGAGASLGAGAAAGGGLGAMFAGIGGGLAAASANLAGFLPSGFGGQLGAPTDYMNPFDAAGIDFKQLGIGIVASFAGGKLGSAIGESLFGKEAESAIGQSIGTAIGSYWGTIGATIGAFIGSMVDVAFGGDGKKRFNIGIQTGVQDRDVFSSQVGASGLTFGAKAKRAGAQGREVAEEMLDLFLAMDEQLTMISAAAGISVNLAGVSLGGKTSEAGGRRGTGFFGSAAMNAVSAEQLQAAPKEFVQQWIEVVTNSIHGEFRDVVIALEGDAQQIMAGYAAALSLKGIFDQGGQLFTDIEGFRATFEILGETFQREGEGIADTVARLVSSAGLLALLGVLDEFDTASAALGVSVADAVGGVDNLAALTAQFTNLFTTEAEQLEIVQNQLSEVFDNLGIAIPATSEGFQALVESIDLTQEGSVNLLATLLQIAPAFVAVTDAAAAAALEAEKLAESEAKEALRALALAEREAELATRQAERAALDLARAHEAEARAAQAAVDAIIAAHGRLVSATAAVQQGYAALFGGSTIAIQIEAEQNRINAMNDASQDAQDAQRDQYRAAMDLYQLEMRRYEDSIRAAERLNSAVNANLLGNVSTLMPLQKVAEAQRQFDELVSKARGGDTKAAQEAARFSSELLQINRDTFASSDRYTAAFLATNATLSQLEGIFGAAMSPTAPAIISTDATTAAVITMTDTLSRLMVKLAEEERVADIEERNFQLSGFVDSLSDLALAKDESVLKLIHEMDLGLNDLAVDINMDGVIDALELSNAFLKLIDTNNNKFITVTEALAAGLGADSELVKAISEAGAGGITIVTLADAAITAASAVTLAETAAAVSQAAVSGGAVAGMSLSRKYQGYVVNGGTLSYSEWLATPGETFNEIGFDRGGITTKPTRAVLSINSRSEAVIPLDQFTAEIGKVKTAIDQLTEVQEKQTNEIAHWGSVHAEQTDEMQDSMKENSQDIVDSLNTPIKTSVV